MKTLRNLNYNLKCVQYPVIPPLGLVKENINRLELCSLTGTEDTSNCV